MTSTELPQRPTVLLDRRASLLGRPGGWERCTHELADRLTGDVVAVTPHRPLSRAAATAWEWSALPRQAREYSLAHFPAFPPTPAVRGRVVYTLHDLVWWRYPETATRAGRHYYRRLAERALETAHIVTVSHAVAAEIQERFAVPSERLDVIHPGVRPAATSVVAEERDRPYVLAIGSIEPRKNLDRLLAAWQRSGAGVRADLLLVGRLAWGRLPAGAHHLGVVDDDRLDRLYAGAAAVAAVSTYEGFGLPVVEALAAGCPVVASDIAAFREVAGEHATFVRADDVADIATALRAAVDGQLARPPSSAGTRFSWEAFAAAHKQLYRRLIPA